MQNDTLTIAEAAEVMKVNKKTVEELIHSCSLRAAQIGRSYVLFKKDVLEYVENEIIRQTAERMKKPLQVDSRGRPKAR